MVKNSQTTGSKTLGKLFQYYLPAKTHRTYSCLHCRAQLANHDELISKVKRKGNGNSDERRVFLLSVVSRKSRSSLFIQFCVNWTSAEVSNRFLLEFSVNVNTSAAEERVLLTGLHEVADIYCECCKTLLGWKYVSVRTRRCPTRVAEHRSF